MLTALAAARTSVAHQSAGPSQVREWGSRRAWPAAMCLVLLAVGYATAPSISLLATFLSLVCLFRAQGRAAAPSLAVVTLLVGASATGVAAALFGTDLGRARPLVLAVQVSVGLAALMAARRRPAAQGVATPWIALIPAVLAVGVGVLQAFSTTRAASWGLVSTDIAEHVLLLGTVQEAGHLEYGSTVYPRGLQALLSLSIGPGAGAVRSVDLLASDLVTYCAVTWFAFGLVLWVAAALASREATRRGLRGRQNVLAASVAPWAVLGSLQTQEALLYLGAAPAMLGIVSLWSLTSTWDERSPQDQILVAAAVFLAVSHLWQPLIVAPLLAVATLVPRLLREERPGRKLVAGACGWSLALLFAAPALTAVPAAGAVSIASYYGVLPGVPLALVVIAGVGLVVCLARIPRPESVSALALGLVVLVMLVAAGGGLDLAQYYPRKSTWLLALFCLPFGASALIASASRAWTTARQALEERGPAGPLVRVAGPAAAALLVLGVAGPGVLQPQSVLHEAVRGDTDVGLRRWEMAAGEYAPGPVLPVAAALAKQEGQPGSFVLSKLFRFRTGQPTTFGAPDQLCQDFERVGGREDPLVLTDLPTQVIRQAAAEQGCQLGEVRSVGGGYAPAVEQFSSDLLASPTS